MIKVCSFDCIGGWREYGWEIWDNGGASGWGNASDISNDKLFRNYSE